MASISKTIELDIFDALHPEINLRGLLGDFVAEGLSVPAQRARFPMRQWHIGAGGGTIGT
jgi:hypothetical protein